MRVAATSDLHLSTDTAPYVWRALEEVAAAGPWDCVVLAGDILDQADVVSSRLLLELRERVAALGRVMIVAGNHDQHDHPRTPLEVLDGVAHVVTTPGLTPLGVVMPYWPSTLWGDVVRGLAVDSVGVPMVWAHQGFRGAYRNAMTRDTDGIPVAEVPAGYLVATGHYHCPQVAGPVVYCGSPYEATFAEEGQRKGFLVWDNLLVSTTPWRHAYSDLGAPRHRTILWDPAVGPPITEGLSSRDRVRVRTTATRRDARAAAAQLAAAGLEAAPVLAQPDEAEGRNLVSASLGPWEAADAYVDRVILPRGDVDPDDMARFKEDVLWR